MQWWWTTAATGLAAGQPPPPAAALARGTLLVELAHQPQDGRVNLLRFVARDPQAAGLTLTQDPDGLICLFQTAGDQTRAWSLPAPVPEAGEEAIVTMGWDAAGPGPASGHLTCWLPQRGRLCSVILDRTLPLAAADAARLVARGPWMQRAGSVRHLALGDGLLPPMPLQGIAPQSLVATPAGPVPIGALRAGAEVTLARGGVARVLWAGPVSLPPVGLTAPYLLRAPYLGLAATIALSGDQRLRLRDNLVEYAFATEEVALAARHLADDRSVIAVPRGRPVIWRQVVTDRPGPIVVAGLAVEPLDPGLLRQTAGALAHDLLAALPDPGGAAVPLLRAYEAAMLRRMRAA